MSADEPRDLEVRGLSVEFRTPRGIVPAVRGVDVVVGGGRIVGLVGESGSGKSATALAVLRLLHPRARIASGEILFRGADLVRLSERELRRIRGRHISMVPQDPLTALNPGLRVGAQLKAALRTHAKLTRAAVDARAGNLLEQVHLPEARTMLRRYPHELSGGQRQRVVIALALAGDPQLLIADEATTALDVTTQLQILRLLRERNERTGLSVLVISHDLGVVAEICDSVYVMRAGSVIEHGPADDVLTSPREPYTRQLLDSLPDPSRRDEPLGVAQTREETRAG